MKGLEEKFLDKDKQLNPQEFQSPKRTELTVIKDGAIGSASPRSPNRGNADAPLTDYNRYSVKFDIIEDDDEPIEAHHYTTQDYLKFALIAAAVIGIGYLLYHWMGADAFAFVLQALGTLVRRNSLFSYVMLILFQFVFGCVLFMPGLSTFNILQAYLMQSFWKSLIISFTGAYLASLLTFSIIKKFFRQQIIEHFRNKVLFRIVYLEVKKKPWTMGLAFNLLFIPASVKNYLISLTSITLEQFAVVVAVAHLIFCSLFSFVGYQMKDLNSLFHGKNWSEKNTAEKVQGIFTYSMLALTMGLMGGFAYVAKQKYQEIEAQHRLERALVKSRATELRNNPAEGSNSVHQHGH